MVQYVLLCFLRSTFFFLIYILIFFNPSTFHIVWCLFFILLLATMIHIMITMTQMLMLTSTKNDYKEEMDRTKKVQHLRKKKKKGPRNILKQLGLIHICQKHLLPLQKPYLVADLSPTRPLLPSTPIKHQPNPYHLMYS